MDDPVATTDGSAASSLPDALDIAVPVPAGERLVSLDVLRGLALLGMFIVHFHVRSSEPGGINDVVRTLIWRLVETKSHGTFALLFGAGFAIQLGRAARVGRPFAARYLRRLAVLALFGVAAHALFGFNVLLGYAAWGVPLLLLRNQSTRVLVVTALVSAMSVPLYHLVFQQYLTIAGGPGAIDAAYDASRASAATVAGALHAAEAQESYRVLLSARLAHMAWFYRQPFSFLPGPTLALFIAGFLLVRHKVFEDPLSHRRLIVVMAAAGAMSWLTANWLIERWQLGPLALVARDQWLTFTYVGGALLLMAQSPRWLEQLKPVATAGRMALTNYLLQIAALDILFSGYAVGLGQVTPIVGLAAAVACFAAEVVLSMWWFTRFRFGPAEWLWRTLTYGRPPRMVAS